MALEGLGYRGRMGLMATDSDERIERCGGPRSAIPTEVGRERERSSGHGRITRVTRKRPTLDAKSVGPDAQLEKRPSEKLEPLHCVRRRNDERDGKRPKGRRWRHGVLEPARPRNGRSGRRKRELNDGRKNDQPSAREKRRLDERPKRETCDGGIRGARNVVRTVQPVLARAHHDPNGRNVVARR